MKQQITDSQFDELTNEFQEKLKDWAYEKGYIVNRGVANIHGKYYEIHSFLPNVGQMIEFLDEKLGQDEWVRKLYAIESDLVGEPYTKRYIARFPRTFKYGTGYPNELCDALWEAVKEILEN